MFNNRVVADADVTLSVRHNTKEIVITNNLLKHRFNITLKVSTTHYFYFLKYSFDKIRFYKVNDHLVMLIKHLLKTDHTKTATTTIPAPTRN